MELMLISARLVFCLCGPSGLSSSPSHTFLHAKDAVLVCLCLLPLSLVSCRCCWCFGVFLFFFFLSLPSPKIKRHTPIYSTGNKDKSERLSRRGVFCLTKPRPSPDALSSPAVWSGALAGNLLRRDATFPAARAEVMQKGFKFL